MQIGIVAHVKRSDQAHDLMQAVNAEVCNVDDSEFFSIWESTRRCAVNHITVLGTLASMAQKGEWVVVLEDDAVPCPGFRTQVAAALKCAPSPLVGLYLGTGNPSGVIQRNISAALREAQAWLTADFFISAVAYAVKSDSVENMLLDIRTRDDELPLRITRWAQANNILAAYTNPSLCNHADTESTIYPGIPLMERSKNPRRAHVFGTGRTRWDTPAVQIAPAPKWSRDYREV